MVFRTGGRALSLALRAAPAQVALYMSLAIVGGIAPLAVAWLTKLVVDQLAAGPLRWPDVAWPAAGVAGSGVVVAVIPQAVHYLRAEVERRVGLLATAELYAAVDRFVGLPRFEDPAFLDRIQVARSSAANGPGTVVDGGLGVARALFTVSGFAGTLLLLGPWMAGVVLIAGVPAMLAELALSRRRAAMVAETGQATRRELFYSSLLMDPSAAKEVRLFGAGRYLWRRMAADIRTINAAHRRIDRRELAVQSGLAVLAAAVTGGVLLWAVHSAMAGVLTVGDVALVVAAIGAVQGALATAVTDVASVRQALLLFGHYLAVADAAPDLPIRRPARPTPVLRSGIELHDVWFRYAEDQPWVLRGVSLVLEKGRSAAIVGLNGAGKTTLVKLLCRLYDPTRGAVLWDGVDLRDLDPEDLRGRIRAVFQDPTWYDLTARENIAIGDLSAFDAPDRIEWAARQSGVHEILTSLPCGYNTLLTRIFFSRADQADPTSGVVLSGGQWQRVGIARGLVLDQPDLLILDEPSSSLDAEAEHEVHARLREHQRGRTTLLISHRLGVVREADLIVVLSGGRIVERGTHQELVTLGGAYARLFEIQAAGYRATAAERAG